MNAKNRVAVYKIIRSTLAPMAMLAVVGCTQPQDCTLTHGEQFNSEIEKCDTARLMNAQAARGAANDATLHACHFTGSLLNSLGTQKLDAMVADDGALPLTVWMDVPEDEMAQGRREAIGKYLTARGLTADQIKFSPGCNPGTDHPSADGLKGLATLEGATAGSGGDSGSAATTPH